MKYSGFMAAVAIGACTAIAPAAAGQEELSRGEKIERLREDHREWIEQEVVYIITEREEDVFLSLETLEERNRFIEVFWEKRDPHPATPENEFRDEHYRRIEYANQYLGRDTFRDGWRTDRGRYYIILGEPRSATPSTATTKWFRANSGSTRAMSRRDCLRSSISSSSSDTTSGSTACTTRWWMGRNRWSAASTPRAAVPRATSGPTKRCSALMRNSRTPRSRSIRRNPATGPPVGPRSAATS